MLDLWLACGCGASKSKPFFHIRQFSTRYSVLKYLCLLHQRFTSCLLALSSVILCSAFKRLKARWILSGLPEGEVVVLLHNAEGMSSSTGEDVSPKLIICSYATPFSSTMAANQYMVIHSLKISQFVTPYTREYKANWWVFPGNLFARNHNIITLALLRAACSFQARLPPLV